MKIIGYIRVSTEYQVDSKLGLEAQTYAIENYGLNNNFTIKEIFRDEAISGGKGLEKRPGLVDAINALGKGDLLVVAKRDRLGRDALLMAMIEAGVKRKGAKIISVAGEGTHNDDPTGMLMSRMIDAFSEYERLIIGQRITAALAVKKRRNERVGYIPYGFQLSENGVNLTEKPCEKTLLDHMKELRKSGISIRGIANHLNEKNMLNRDGNKWSKSSILRVCVERLKRESANV
jgi:site-specific DNA recombinase